MGRSENEKLADLLRSKGLTISCAESCTGGMIGSTITDLPGSSEYFLGSAVTYSNDSKNRLLHVPEEILKEHGAVSPEVARCMAEGAVKLYGSDVAIAVTGIAGPDGGTLNKPVGLVYIAVTDGARVVVSRNRFEGDRSAVRACTVLESLIMMCDMLEGKL